MVEVVLALADRQERREITLDSPCTLYEAVRRSKILDSCPEVDLDSAKCGVFGHRRPFDWTLVDGDRVEIYRPLFLSPVEARRLRAERRSQTANKR